MSGEVCIHGSLARQCYSCELLAEIADLTFRNSKIITNLKSENERLRAFVAVYDEWLNASPTVFRPGSHSSEDEMNRGIAMRKARAAIDAKAVDGET